MIYEVSNPSDRVTIEADDDKVAIAAVLLIGEGQMGLDREDGQDTFPVLLLASHQQVEDTLIAKGFADGVKGYSEFVGKNLEAVAACLASAAVCSISERKGVLKVIEGSGRDPAVALAEWNETQRTSLNDICGVAHSYAKALREKAAKNAQSEG